MTYQASTKQGTTFAVQASDWIQARKIARILCRQQGETFICLHLTRQDLTDHIDKPVVIELMNWKGQYNGTRWGILTSVPKGTTGIFCVNVGRELFHVKRDQITLTQLVRK